MVAQRSRAAERLIPVGDQLQPLGLYDLGGFAVVSTQQECGGDEGTTASEGLSAPYLSFESDDSGRLGDEVRRHGQLLRGETGEMRVRPGLAPGSL
jgi:hypothetical protein